MTKPKKNMGRYLSMLMVAVMVVGAMPLQVFAQPSNPTSVTSVLVDGENITISEDGTFHLGDTLTSTLNTSLEQSYLPQAEQLESSDPDYESWHECRFGAEE